MFGRHKKKADGQETHVSVDATLEGDVAKVEQSVDDYLIDPTDDARRSLLAALEALEAQTAQSDAYGASIVGSGALGYAWKGDVVGETSLDPLVDEVPSAELAAQIELVKAAKAEVRGPTPATFSALQEAVTDLAGTREEGPQR